ncbi:MAG TPA: hypothetical protein PLG99_11930 [Kaistiaceae bacterium]|nr:hypothetical protein [Kaistiaceae bacterium]
MRTVAEEWDSTCRPVLDDAREIDAVVDYVRSRAGDDRMVWEVVVKTHAVDLDLLSAALTRA